MTFVLGFLLLVPFCAAGAVLLVVATLGVHIGRSYDLGTALRAAIDRRVRHAPNPTLAPRTRLVRQA